MFENNIYRYPTDEEILKLQYSGKPIFECGMTGHAWMMRREVIINGARTGMSNVEIVEPLIRKMREMGYKVYCDSNVYLKHISLDGKIYRDGLMKKPIAPNLNSVAKPIERQASPHP